MKIIFMGTPDFAVPSLQRLFDDGHELLAVFCQPDKPQGRHFTLTPPPVKVLAQQLGIPVYQPATLKDEAAQQIIANLAPDVIAVAAYGKLLPPAVLNIPKYGCINVHASLLPMYRGAAPIQRCIQVGEKKTGVTTMYMAKGLDTGDMILRDELDIPEDMTGSELHDRLSEMGGRLIVMMPVVYAVT